ncbi:hypothetical protein ABIC84_005497 [Mucilaginibacter sp. 3215]
MPPRPGRVRDCSGKPTALCRPSRRGQGEDLQRKARAAGNAIILISELGFSISDLRH